jgi:enamine deaminase RidA (YjgF/YER057c/UK114 family)
MLRKFNPEGASAPPFYSHGAEVAAGSRMLFVSGQVGVKDGALAEGMAEQARIAVENLKRVLAGADMTTANVAKYTFYLTDPADMGAFMGAAAELVASPPAAATLIYVKALAEPGMKIEIEAIAAK